MHEGMQYDASKVNVTSPSKWEIWPFSKALLSAPPFTMGAGN